MGAVYDASSAVYAEHWAPVLHRHARDLVAMLPPAPALPDAGGPRVVVDVAAGAGTLLPVLRELTGTAGNGRGGGLLVALDYSAGMLALADPSVPRVRADAHRLPLATGSADVAVAAFVLFMLDDARTAVADLARVLRPGGWVAAATWGGQDGSEADQVIARELDHAGAPPWPEPQRSDHLTSTPTALWELFVGAGFADVRTESRPLGGRFDAATALALRTGFGALGWRYRQLDAHHQERLLVRAARRLADLPATSFADNSEVLLTVARRVAG
jgi:SAM-dependent methyltransferase